LYLPEANSAKEHLKRQSWFGRGCLLTVMKDATPKRPAYTVFKFSSSANFIRRIYF